MFFIWDVIFGTGIITRRYPEAYGLAYYQGEEWYAQFLWPMFKSKKAGSELSASGPEVGDEATGLARVMEAVEFWEEDEVPGKKTVDKKYLYDMQ